MKLSVCLITYNHAPFIAQAIEGALMQRTNFDFEIIIGEDESTDGTREIVAEYARKYPNKIKALFHSRKDVIYYRGKPTGRRNFIETLKNCSGDYVAILDGDDFWTSPDKLQQQVDFLDQHSECASCAHDVMHLYSDGRQEVWANSRTAYGMVELLTLKSYPPTCSVVFRNHLFGPVPDWCHKVMVGDFCIQVLNAQFGLIGHIPKVMATYRHHAGGVWSGWAYLGREAYAKKIAWNDGLIDFYRTIDEPLGYKYHRVIRSKIAELNYENAWMHYQLHDLALVRRRVLEAFRANPLYFCGAGRMCRLWFAAFCPAGYRAYSAGKRFFGLTPRPEQASS